jgi:hypothetical protein
MSAAGAILPPGTQRALILRKNATMPVECYRSDSLKLISSLPHFTSGKSKKIAQ